MSDYVRTGPAVVSKCVFCGSKNVSEISHSAWHCFDCGAGGPGVLGGPPRFECNPDESAGLAEPAPLATYTMTLHGPEVHSATRESYTEALLAVLNAYTREAEENLTDLLPDGYSVKIERWDA